MLVGGFNPSEKYEFVSSMNIGSLGCWIMKILWIINGIILVGGFNLPL